MATDNKAFKAGDRVFHASTPEESGTVVGHTDGRVLAVFDDTPHDVESVLPNNLHKVKS